MSSPAVTVVPSVSVSAGGGRACPHGGGSDSCRNTGLWIAVGVATVIAINVVVCHFFCKGHCGSGGGGGGGCSQGSSGGGGCCGSKGTAAAGPAGSGTAASAAAEEKRA